jgi:uncharacterized membrane protein
MDNTKATILIKQYRRTWRLKGSDFVVARKVERVYLGIAVGYVIIAFLFITLDQHSLLRTRVVRALIVLVCATFCYWQSWRFAQIRKLHKDLDANMDSQ